MYHAAIFCDLLGDAMTEIEVITAANDSGLVYYGMGKDRAKFIHHLQAFAVLIAAHEREACAKLCEAARETIWEYHEEHLKAAACNVCTNLAQAIRARGTQKEKNNV